MNKKLIRSLIIVALLVVVFIIVPGLINLLTDWFWFAENGYHKIFTTILESQVLIGLVAGTAAFLLVFANYRAAFYIARHNPGSSALERAGININKYFKKISLLAVLVLSIFTGLAASSEWQTVLKYLNYTSFDAADPVFGKNIAYYFFTLPFWKAAINYGFWILIISLLGAFFIYLVKGYISLPSRVRMLGKSVALEKEEKKGKINKTAKTHLSILGAFVFLLLALKTHFIRIPEMLYSTTGSFVGASYADVNASLIFLRILTFVCLLAVILILINIYRPKNKLAVGAILLYLSVAVIGSIYAEAVQRLIVIPNELAKETPYIKHNIEATQTAWGLDQVEKRELAADTSLTKEDIENNQLTIKNIRLWDREPLLDTFSQIQEIRTYYDFISVDNDRYNINDEYRQIMLSPRELNSESLPNKTFINERFTFTHGYGLTLGPVNQVTSEGLPVLFSKDLPPVSSIDSLQIKRPEIYYGELSNDYVFVNTKAQEFDYPMGEENVYSEYQGKGGVPIESIFKKALFALRFGSLKIFLSNDITSSSRVMYYRDITERVEKVLPFLEFDGDPYMVINSKGDLKWIYDAYTVSSLYPYSQRINSGLNYMRNSVKVVIDAYDGSMEFYLVSVNDPLIETYAKIFDGVFKPLDEMPADLKKHLRYPEDIFYHQTQLYRTYHMEQPQIFYNKEDQWEIPQVDSGEEHDPIMRHLIMKLPGEKSEEFILMIPFTPRNKDNMAAWMVARSDGKNYGKLVVYQFGKQKLVFGPKQINNRINQDAEISRQISLWDQRGSEVIQGNLLVIPIKESLLYVRPLYIRAEGGRIPELKRVIVAYENKIAMEETLDLALSKIFAEEIDISEEGAESVEKEIIEAEDVSKNLPQEAKRIFDEAIAAQRDGDWSVYGEKIKELENILNQLLNIK